MQKYLVPSLLTLAVFITHLFLLSDYGINWDAPMRMMRGQAFADIYLKNKPYEEPERTSPVLYKPQEHVSRYYHAAGEENIKMAQLRQKPLPKQEFEKVSKNSSFYQSSAWNSSFFKLYDEAGHLPFVDILAALSNRFFYQTLGLFGDIESYQLSYIFLSSVGIFIVTLFAFEITGSTLAGLVAGLSLALFPIFFAESHINMKDPIQASFFAGSVWSFWHWVKSDNKKWALAVFAFVILAFSTKANIIFLPLVLLPWLFLIRKTPEFKSWFKIRKLFLYSFLFLIFNFTFLILIWPPAWLDPSKVSDIFKYYLEVGTRADRIQPGNFNLPLGFNAYPLILFLAQTPEIILILASVAIFSILKRKYSDLKTGYLLLLWLMIPIARISVPGTWFYSGLRQFMEVLPALAVLSGLGFHYITSVAPRLIPRGSALLKFSTLLLLSLITFHLSLITYLLHPNQNTYFNKVVGNVSGAADKNLVDWTLTYGNIYKQGVSWLNKNAQKDANLAHLDGSMFAISPLWLREDISISPYHFSGLEQKGEYIISLFDPYKRPIFAQGYIKTFLEPVFTINLDGIDLLYIYKNDPEHLQTNKQNEAQVTNIQIKQVRGDQRDYLEVDLTKDLPVTRIIVSGAPKECTLENHELIALRPTSTINQLIEPQGLFVLNERKVRDLDQIEFSFPAQKARLIQIFPNDEKSCFVKGKITAIHYLKDQ